MQTMHDPSRARSWALGGLLTLALASAVFLALTHEPRAVAVWSSALTAVAALGSAATIRRWADGWPSATPIAALWLLFGVVNLVFVPIHAFDWGQLGPSPADLVFLLFLVPIAMATRAECDAHLPERERREALLDAGLIAVALAAIVYLLMRPEGADPETMVAAAVLSLVATAAFTSFGALSLWVPTRSHVLLFAASAPTALAVVMFGLSWTQGTYDGTSPATNLPFLLAPIAFAATMTLTPHGTAALPRLARPVLPSIAVLTACSALIVVTVLHEMHDLPVTESVVIVLVLGGGIVVRMVAGQRSSAEAQREAEQALERREIALAAADRALERTREANETLRRSEEHLRLVFEAAVDGFVELDSTDMVVRANDAFATMVGLDRGAIEGRIWGEVVARIDGADAAFVHLPESGQGRIQLPEGQIRHLESRSSLVPTDPPRRLLAIRDVTSAKVADQTIRSLFQFLQDRDEDRTRLLRRTNAAIEQERNRIARDLHDGPVQGVSAASLSLEAALLMIKAGDVERGMEVLAKLREELAGEADALRRLMAGLRPPVLEERGLLPAIRDSLMRFGAENGLLTEFEGQLRVSLPHDLETLAFRVVQEALANVAKHAGATSVSVVVDVDADQLRIEVEDDGTGFDTALSREFLAAGRVGLASMRERVELASGTFAVRSSPGRGTAVMATIPLEAALVTVSGT